MAQTYNDLYLDARRELKAMGVEQAQLEARELLAMAAEKSREQLMRDLPLYASDNVAKRFQALMDRRRKGEPLPYIIGEWDFYGLNLEIGPDVLIPRPDTETLADRGIFFARDLRAGWVMDLCAGSGCVGLAIASSCPHVKVIAAEWSEQALAVCRRNVGRTHLSKQVNVVRVNALEPPPRLFSDFDLIVCNPPYIATSVLETLDASVREWEPHIALDGGEDGLDFYRAIAGSWMAALRPGGRLLFEIGYDQVDAVTQILEMNGFEDVQAYRDPAGNWRVVEGMRPRPDLFAGLVIEEEQ